MFGILLGFCGGSFFIYAAWSGSVPLIFPILFTVLIGFLTLLFPRTATTALTVIAFSGLVAVPVAILKEGLPSGGIILLVAAASGVIGVLYGEKLLAKDKNRVLYLRDQDDLVVEFLYTFISEKGGKISAAEGLRALQEEIPDYEYKSEKRLECVLFRAGISRIGQGLPSTGTWQLVREDNPLLTKESISRMLDLVAINPAQFSPQEIKVLKTLKSQQKLKRWALK